MSYKEIETLEDPDGVIAVITEREDSRYLSFRLQKQYESNGQIKNTSYLGRRHIPALRRLLDELEERLNVHADRLKIARVRSES